MSNKLGNPLLVAKAAQNKNVQIAGGLLLGGIAIGSVLLVRKLLQQFNIVDDADDKTVDKAQFTDAFNRTWWQDPKNLGFPVFTAEAAKLNAEKLEDAITGISNSFGQVDFPTVMAVFKNARSKMHVSRITNEYYKAFNMDMYTHLQNRLLNSDLAQVVKYVNQLPDRVK